MTLLSSIVINKRIQHLWLPYYAADLCALAAAYYTALLVRFHSDWGEQLFADLNRMLNIAAVDDLGAIFESFYLASAFRIISLLMVALTVLYALRRLYHGRRIILPRAYAWDVLLCNAIVLCMIYGYFYLTRNNFHPRSLFAPMMMLNVFYCILLRGGVNRALRLLRKTRGIDVHPAVVLGSSEEGMVVKGYIDVVQPHGINVVSELPYDPAMPFSEVERALRQACQEHRVALIISLDKRMTVPHIMQLLEIADSLGRSTKILSDKLDVLVNQARMPVDLIRGVPLVHFEACSHQRFLANCRRAVAWLAAAIASLLLAPLGLLIAGLVRITSPGPVLFLQERIGVNRKPFVMFKFRTMKDGAAEQQVALEELNDSGGGLFKVRDDPRVTPLGRLLRRYSLDELPQFINVLRGDMTLIGPRPLPRRDFENYYEEWHYVRHNNKPGLTCLWQISGRSDVLFHDMCILDVYYLHNQNWILDLEIVLRTAWVVIFAKGAY